MADETPAKRELEQHIRGLAEQPHSFQYTTNWEAA